tara:strand:+ start:238 stop:639 length:402 start_codon:yes stop_codon:yes gene_type:complete
MDVWQSIFEFSNIIQYSMLKSICKEAKSAVEYLIAQKTKKTHKTFLKITKKWLHLSLNYDKVKGWGIIAAIYPRKKFLPIKIFQHYENCNVWVTANVKIAFISPYNLQIRIFQNYSVYVYNIYTTIFAEIFKK